MSVVDRKGSGGGGSAGSTTVDTSNFDNNLSAADDTVQKALDTIDNLPLEKHKGSVQVLNVIDDSLNSPPGGDTVGDAYFVGAVPAGAWAAFSPGDLVVYASDLTWKLVLANSGGLPPDGTRVVVTGLGVAVGGGSFTGHDKEIGKYVVGTGWVFDSPIDGWVVTIIGENDPYENKFYIFDTDVWVIGGGGAWAIVTDTTNFNGNLGPNDTTVQLALETLDEMTGTYLLFSDTATSGFLVPAVAAFVSLKSGVAPGGACGWPVLGVVRLRGIAVSFDVNDVTRDFQVRVYERDAAGALTQLAVLDNLTTDLRIASRRDLAVAISAGSEIVARVYRTSGVGNSSFSCATVSVEIANAPPS